nr:MAG: hypothetical protein [Caudoviricetes sp.]
MNSKKIKELAEQAGYLPDMFGIGHWDSNECHKFAELIVKECLDKIETYKIPCGNSPAGEMACEWTYDALKSIRGDIKETFGIEE